MAEQNRSELYAVEEVPLTTLNGSNGHHSPAGSSEESTFVLPASREQTRYWMLAQLDPSSTASNMAISFDIEGAIDDHAAEAAIAALTMRHEALRTLFRLENGVLSQVVLERPLYHFAVESLSRLPADQREAAAAASVDRHGHTLIDLHDGPVLHARLIHLDDRHHIMALTMNHIVCDGWSNGILIRDFTLLYEAIRAHRDAVLPALPFQFADFSLWQNEYLESPAAAEASAFWKAHITADMPALDLPTDAPRTSGRSFPGHIESALLPKEIDDRLKDYCRKSGSTKHIVLLAAFEALCARYTGQKEFLLGSTIANRTQPGMEDVVGRFANPQIIVAKVNGDPTFAELEQRVREWETAAYTHQDLPFSRIIEDFQIDQAGATSQFLQVWFLYQKAFMQPQHGETIRVTPRRSVSGGVDFDVLVSIVERAEGPRIQMEYNTLLFKPERIRGLIASFTRLLGEGLLDPSKPLSQLAVEVDTATSAPATVTVGTMPTLTAAVSSLEVLSLVDRVRAQAEHSPDDLVIAEAARSLTWQQLEEQSSAVAAELARQGAAAGHTIAVCLTPQSESAIALLAAMKTGAAVLPLPPHASSAQVSDLLSRLPGTLLLAPAGFSGTVSFEDFSTLGPAPDFPVQPSGLFLLLEEATTAACATISAAALLRSVDTAVAHVGIESGEALLAFAGTSPIDACLDFLLAFSTGSQLSFADDLEKHTIEAQLAQHQVTRLITSPANLKTLFAANWPGDRRVSILVRGGRLPAALTTQPSPLLPRNTRSAVYLLTTPATGYIAAQTLLPSSGSGLIALGGNLLVQGPDGQALPLGAFGELCTSSGAALGYMARTSTTGTIELLDATERFLHIRGHRICLGDIEDALFAQPQVADALAAVLEGETGQRLVVYLVARQHDEHPERSSSALRQHLGATLPSHLVPSEYMWVSSLPRTVAGRIDFSQLPQAEAPAPVAREVENTGALTTVEEKLSAIWREVLGLRQVDIRKPFFELGGSSLLLVRLFARINKAFDTSLPITAIFDAQTIAELALTLGGATQISPLVQVQPHGSKPPLFMVHSYLLYKGLSTMLGPDQPFFGLRELDQDGHLTIEQRIERYVAEIRKVQPQGPYHVAGWCAAGPLTVEVARQLMLAGQEVNYLALFDSWLPGYLESIESASPQPSYKTASIKLAFHRSKMRGLTLPKKARYLWMAAARVAKGTQYRIYLRNWDRLRKLSEKYHFTLPQFMHNTSLDTFSALKDYRGQRMPVRLTLIRASDSREVPNAGPACGWDRVADQGVDVLWAPGDHETMFVGENLKVTASIVQRGLEASAAKPATAAASAASSLRGTTLHVDCPST